jgi:4-hydroxyphenylacetate 3-monooxygenase
LRQGKDYLGAMHDDRTVYVDGRRVDDIVSHPALAPIARTISELFDIAADPANEMIYVSPETGNPANKAFMTPRGRRDLQLRREAIELWAQHTCGFVGRSPDHVAGFFAGFASGYGLFDGDRVAGENVLRFYRRLLDEDLFVTYVIIPPQVDRNATAHGWQSEHIQVGVLDERDDGIVVRGSQMLGTTTAVSDYVFVSCIKPLDRNDEMYALSFVVPVGARGVKLYCRRPYASSQPSSFDYPLSTRFDETDALAVFDDVFVPWEDVFVYRDVELVRSQFFTTAAHVLGNTQAQIRLAVKTQFLCGLAKKIAVTNRIDGLPPVQEKLGDLGSLASTVAGMVIAAEATSQQDEFGVERPNPQFLYSAMGLQSELYPRMTMLVRELAGGGMIQLPSSFRELLDPETRGDMERYVQSPGVPARERVKLFKLAWDSIGSEFGGRHLQYELFYAGAPFVAKGYAYRNFPFERAAATVDQFLSTYALPDEGND